jgi:hypothetical protein
MFLEKRGGALGRKVRNLSDLIEKKSNVFATTRRANRVELIPDTKRKLSRKKKIGTMKAEV